VHPETVSKFLSSALALACGKGEDEVTLDTPLIELDIDSLVFVSVISQLEAIYGFELQAEDFLELYTARDVGALVGMAVALSHKAQSGTSAAPNIGL